MNNEGTFGIGDTDSSAPTEFRVGKDLSNSGQIVLENGKTAGNKLIDVSGKSNSNFVQSSRLVAGAYDYELKRGTGSDNRNWYLISDLSNKTNPDTPNNGDNGDNGKVIPIVRPEAGAYIGNEAIVHSSFPFHKSPARQDR